ncbi:acyltransferase [uncultured Flavobacterium sp.]|uniref:acyltransferase n=1 Tax=uncultured Flavobacterium sp. TaxID=165435 RepID=UPI0030EF6BFC|tara:strand:+ start:19555 stop:20163 length:609 start_codon:yes stop_codon:yes gene_type:complete
MRFIIKILFYIYRKLIYYCVNHVWLRIIKWRFVNLNIKGEIKLYGFPLFEIYGETSIGSETAFISSTKYNPAGLFKPCNIYVAKEGVLNIGLGCGLSGVTIVCWNKIDIGDYVGLGANVSLWDTDFHGIKNSERVNSSLVSTGAIKIGNYAWIGGNSIILKGVTIGDRSVVGAGSVVTKNIPQDEIWAGNPAKFIRKIENNN